MAYRRECCAAITTCSRESGQFGIVGKSGPEFCARILEMAYPVRDRGYKDTPAKSS